MVIRGKRAFDSAKKERTVKRICAADHSVASEVSNERVVNGDPNLLLFLDHRFPSMYNDRVPLERCSSSFSTSSIEAATFGLGDGSMQPRRHSQGFHLDDHMHVIIIN